MESLSISEMKAYHRVYHVENSAAPLLPDDSGEPVAVLCLSHWTLLYSVNDSLYLFDPTGMSLVCDKLNSLGIPVTLLNGQHDQFQRLGSQDKFCGHYCVLAEKIRKRCNASVFDVVMHFSVWFNRYDYDKNLFKIQCLTVLYRIGWEFRDPSIITTLLYLTPHGANLN
jgi:hypothetical protein